MARTNSALVRGIIVTQDDVDLTPFIDTASQLVSDVCGNSGYPDTGVGSKMELIERWLAAHFYAIFDTQLAAAKAGTVNVSYQYKIDLGLSNTAWGQAAMRIDNLGNLVKLENSAKTKRQIRCSISWVGQASCPYRTIDLGVV